MKKKTSVHTILYDRDILEKQEKRDIGEKGKAED